MQSTLESLDSTDSLTYVDSAVSADSIDSIDSLDSNTAVGETTGHGAHDAGIKKLSKNLFSDKH